MGSSTLGLQSPVSWQRCSMCGRLGHGAPTPNCTPNCGCGASVPRSRCPLRRCPAVLAAFPHPQLHPSPRVPHPAEQLLYGHCQRAAVAGQPSPAFYTILAAVVSPFEVQVRTCCTGAGSWCMQQRAVWCALAAVAAILWVVAIPILPANLSTAFQEDDRRAAQLAGAYRDQPALSRRTQPIYAAAVDTLCCDLADPTNRANDEAFAIYSCVPSTFLAQEFGACSWLGAGWLGEGSQPAALVGVAPRSLVPLLPLQSELLPSCSLRLLQETLQTSASMLGWSAGSWRSCPAHQRCLCLTARASLPA